MNKLMTLFVAIFTGFGSLSAHAGFRLPIDHFIGHQDHYFFQGTFSPRDVNRSEFLPRLDSNGNVQFNSQYWNYQKTGPDNNTTTLLRQSTPSIYMEHTSRPLYRSSNFSIQHQNGNISYINKVNYTIPSLYRASDEGEVGTPRPTGSISPEDLTSLHFNSDGQLSHVMTCNIFRGNVRGCNAITKNDCGRLDLRRSSEGDSVADLNQKASQCIDLISAYGHQAPIGIPTDAFREQVNQIAQTIEPGRVRENFEGHFSNEENLVNNVTQNIISISGSRARLVQGESLDYLLDLMRLNNTCLRYFPRPQEMDPRVQRSAGPSPQDETAASER